jgi:hypothetical protein
MYYTATDPFTRQEVYVARNPRDRKLQRARREQGHRDVRGEYTCMRF